MQGDFQVLQDHRGSQVFQALLAPPDYLACKGKEGQLDLMEIKENRDPLVFLAILEVLVPQDSLVVKVNEDTMDQ